jgi:LmbE family N-acetylglucosaminyl deacetylase
MRALFMGAHPDDVEVSAGGTVQTLVEDGWEVWITTTVYEGSKRLDEGLAAAEILGASYIPVSGTHEEIVGSWSDIGDFDLIVTTPITDSHPAHRTTAKIGLALTRRNDVDLWEMNHAIPGGIANSPDLNHFVTFSFEQETNKQRALKAHKTQDTKYGDWWRPAILARDRYLGLMVERGQIIAYAEGFRIVHSRS